MGFSWISFYMVIFKPTEKFSCRGGMSVVHEYGVVSSAWLATLESSHSLKRLIISILNKSGPKAEPWGTPNWDPGLDWIGP